MLLFKDLPDGGLPEHQALKGMLDVGNEFMSEVGAEGEVRRSGQFIEMRRRSVGEFVRLCAMYESSDARRITENSSGEVLGDDQDRAGGYVPYKRSRMFCAMADEDQIDRGPDNVPGFKQSFRLPRYTKVEQRVHDVDHTTQSGRARVWHLGDGENLLAVREVFDPQDPRYFMGVLLSGVSTRRTRVSRVELVKINAETGKASQVLMEFETFSGLGFDPGSRSTSTVADPSGSEAMFDATRVFTGRAGHLWGRYTSPNYRMDPSASYAVADPAWHPDNYLSLVVVHGRAVDALHPEASILKQLTCSYTTKEGEVEHSTIVLPPHHESDYIWSAIAVDLLRMSPTHLLLRVNLASVLAPGAHVTFGNNLSGWRFYRSSDAGRSWELLDFTGIFGVTRSQVGMMAGREGTALLFTAEVDLIADGLDKDMIVIYELAESGITLLASINGRDFSDGLDTGFLLGGQRSPRYFPVAFGGGVQVKTPQGVKHALWMQFDPFGVLRATNPRVIEYPNARPMLMVSLDGGATWERRFLPDPWQQRVGFVVAADKDLLLVPVYEPRRTKGSSVLPLRVRIYESKDAGATWKATRWKFTLPAQTWVDGQMAPSDPRYAISDYRYTYNRGELFPLLALRNRLGDVLPMHPGRPWIADSRVKEPDYA